MLQTKDIKVYLSNETNSRNLQLHIIYLKQSNKIQYQIIFYWSKSVETGFLCVINYIIIYWVQLQYIIFINSLNMYCPAPFLVFKEFGNRVPMWHKLYHTIMGPAILCNIKSLNTVLNHF